ncbi:MAG: hypothetical protein ACKOQ6_01905 [Bacteroidota bacterium]
MKKTISFIILFVGITMFANAQQPVYVTGGPPPKHSKEASGGMKINLTAFGGYFFAETFQLYNGGNVYLNDGGFYGASLGFSKDPRIEFELTWQRQITGADAYYYYYDGNIFDDDRVTGDVDIEYFMMGINRMKNLNDHITVYGGFSAGMVVFTPQDLDVSAVEKFTVALKGGLNLHITDRIGLKLQPQLYIPIQSFGASAFIGSGGSGVSANGYSSITQFGGIGGLTFSF